MTPDFPMAHTLTFLSSPPVTMTPDDLRPILRQFTLLAWATNSSAFRQRMRAVCSESRRTGNMLSMCRRLGYLRSL